MTATTLQLRGALPFWAREEDTFSNEVATATVIPVEENQAKTVSFKPYTLTFVATNDGVLMKHARSNKFNVDEYIIMDEALNKFRRYCEQGLLDSEETFLKKKEVSMKLYYAFGLLIFTLLASSSFLLSHENRCTCGYVVSGRSEHSYSGSHPSIF